MMKGFDSFVAATAYAPALAADGYQFACRYYRPNVHGSLTISLGEARALCEAGLWLVSVYQYTSDKLGYFTLENAARDAAAAIAKAEQMGQPKDSAIYFACDCNPAPQDADEATDALIRYFAHIAERVGGAGWAPGVYGSGLVCRAIMERDLAIHNWLSNATGWWESRTWDKWSIKQTSLPHTLQCGLQVDDDTCLNPEIGGMWRLP